MRWKRSTSVSTGRGKRPVFEGGQALSPRTVDVPGDLSGAAFWCALAAGTPNGEIHIQRVGLNPTRTAMLDVLRRAGASVVANLADDSSAEPRGDPPFPRPKRDSFEISAEGSAPTDRRDPGACRACGDDACGADADRPRRRRVAREGERSHLGARRRLSRHGCGTSMNSTTASRLESRPVARSGGRRRRRPPPGNGIRRRGNPRGRSGHHPRSVVRGRLVPWLLRNAQPTDIRWPHPVVDKLHSQGMQRSKFCNLSNFEQTRLCQISHFEPVRDIPRRPLDAECREIPSPRRAAGHLLWRLTMRMRGRAPCRTRGSFFARDHHHHPSGPVVGRNLPHYSHATLLRGNASVHNGSSLEDSAFAVGPSFPGPVSYFLLRATQSRTQASSAPDCSTQIALLCLQSAPDDGSPRFLRQAKRSSSRFPLGSRIGQTITLGRCQSFGAVAA